MGTLIRHFLSGAILGLAEGVVSAPLAALLMTAIGLPARLGASCLTARLATVDLASVAEAAEIENRGTSVTTDLAEAVVAIAHGLPCARINPYTARPRGRKMSRRIRPANPEKRRRKQELQERRQDTNLIMDTAARFTCSTEVAEDFAYQCSRGREDVEYDLLYNRVAHEIWRDRPGPAQQIAEALASFAGERERYVHALQELEKRFSALAQQGPQHEHLEPVEKYQELIRSRIFPEHPPLA